VNVKLTIREERGEQMRDWLLNARRERGLTQLDVAKKLDISEAYFNYIENGERQKKMDIALASKLSMILEIPLAEIIEFEKSEGRM
jgi:transcriptional regulator with XRE-family HTH domain